MKLAAALTTALVCVASQALAETPPSRWDRAKQPEIQEEYQLHLTVLRILSSDISTKIPTGQMINDAQHMRVLAMLQAAGAEKSDNPLLRFDLAKAYAKVQNHSRAVEAYKSAMRDFPDHVLATESRFSLAIECGYVGDHECESRVYRQIIASTSAPAELATPSLNLAEVDMHTHDLKEAIDGYREVYNLCGQYESYQLTPALAQWGLAVALDRAGEVKEADIAANTAVSTVAYHIENLTKDGIFFYPSYEVHWYQAISHAALARRGQTPKERVGQWLLAERHLTEWVKGGEKNKDYWLPIAKARLATYAKERKAAEAALLKAPAAPEEEENLMVPGFGPVVPPVVRPKIKPPKPSPKVDQGDLTL